MIARLSGEVVEQDGDIIVLDVGGVGYAVRATASVHHQLVGQQSSSSLQVIVHTEVRENDISLFGFSSAIEKRVFLLLQRVRGVGARLALQIVSSVGAQNVLSTIGQGSVAALCAVPGVGKKTAERIIVELREMVAALLQDASLATSSLPQHVEVSSVTQDAIMALEKLGFAHDQARQAVAAATEDLEREANGKKIATETILHNALTKVADVRLSQ